MDTTEKQKLSMIKKEDNLYTIITVDYLFQNQSKELILS